MNNLDISIIEAAHSVLAQESNALMRAIDLNSQNLADAVKLIVSSKKLIITGVGKSGLIAKKISATFSSIGVPSLFLHPVEALHGDLGIVEQGDTTIMISKSGSTEELVKLHPFISSRTKIISIIGNTNSFLGQNSDIVIDASVEKEACAINMAPTTSTTVALALGDALAVAAMTVNKVDVNEFVKNHPSGQLGRNATLKVKDVMSKGSKIPIVAPDDSFKKAIIEITEKGLGCVCVLEENVLKGIITDGDIRRALHKYDNLADLQSDAVMTKQPITISSDELLSNALSLMENRKSQINVLPVVDEGICVGVIRLHDIIGTKL